MHTFTPKLLNATFSDPAVSHLVMQKPTGEFVVAAWSEQLMNGLTPIAVQHNVSRYTLALKPSDTYLLVLSGENGTRSHKCDNSR